VNNQAQSDIRETPRYIMLGGFLGAGKTTTVLALAQHLKAKGLRVGLITNDQGRNLVDTAMLASHGFAVEEIAGGCFCCRFQSLQEAAEHLTQATRPDVFIAEAVGSCTDLVATVSYPLRRIYGDQFAIAPFTVVVDPRRAARVFGLEDGKKFSDKVLYIYKKQLEEAQIILLNKCDILEPEQQQALKSCLESTYPSANLLEVSARELTGLAPWFEQVENALMPGGEAMQIDYGIYGEGEALLGWLNAAISVKANDYFDGNELVQLLAENLQTRLKAADTEIAHLKMTLNPSASSHSIGLAILNLVSNELIPEASQQLADELNAGELILNIRAESPPEALQDIVTEVIEALSSPEISISVSHLEAFAPGQPVPVYRDEQSLPLS